LTKLRNTTIKRVSRSPLPLIAPGYIIGGLVEKEYFHEVGPSYLIDFEILMSQK